MIKHCKFWLVVAFLLVGSLAQAAQVLTLHGRDEPETLDPQLSTGIVEANIIINMFEGLVRYHPQTLEPEQGMSSSVTRSADGKVYTFKMRTDSFWSDGKQVTAQDFWDGWERILNPLTASQYAWMLYVIQNAEAYNTKKITDPKQLGFKVVDPTTFQVTLINSTPYFLKMITHHSFLPTRKDLVAKFGDRWVLPENVACNGPFTLKSWVPNKEIILEKNPKYWDKEVKLDSVKFIPSPDFETAIKMYEAGQLDNVTELPPVKVSQLRGRADFVGKPYLLSEYYWFNNQLEEFKDPRVRKALAMAIDRKVLTDKVLKRGDVPIGHMTPPGIAGYTPPPGIEYNPEKAKQLFKEAGYGPGGKPFPTVEILYDSKEEKKMVAEVIQSMWKQHLGVSVTLRNEEWKSYLKSLQTTNFKIGRAGWIGDYVDPNTFLELLASNNAQNHGKYKNPKYDALIAEAAKEKDLVKRAAVLQQAEAIIVEEAPIIPLYAVTKNFLLKPYVKGYYPTIQDVHPLYRVSVEK